MKKKPSAKLSAASVELLAAMRCGVRVHGLFGINSYYFREDTMTRCSKQVDALLRRGLAVERDRDWRGCMVIAALEDEC